MIILAMSMMQDIHSPTGIQKSRTQKVTKHYIILFYFQNNMWFGLLFLYSLLGTNINFPLHIGNVKTPSNDPFSTRGGTLSTNQFESDLLCSCTCIRRPTTMRP